MGIRKSLTVFAVLFGFSAIFGVPAQAATPSDVYAVWADINQGLEAAGGSAVKSMAPSSFSGKKPGHVLSQLSVFVKKLNERRKAAGLAPIAAPPVSGNVTPSMVFDHSQKALEGFAEWAAKRGASFSKGSKASGKTPSDVYSLVDLASRRIDKIN